MGGNFGGHVLLAAGKELQQLLRHAAMAPGPARRGLALVQHLAIEAVGKDVERRLGAVGQFVVSRRIEEMQPSSQLFILIFDFFEIAVQAPPPPPRRER